MSSELINFDELPIWLIDNRFVVTGYRKPELSLLYYLKSLLQIHNESISIWSHILGVIYYLRLIAMAAHSPHPRYKDSSDVLPLLFFYMAGCFSLLSSAMYHTFSPYSSEARHVLIK